MASKPSGATVAGEAPAPQADFITITNVDKSFGSQRVLERVSVRVRRGKTRVVLGLSGSGKSVLMKHMIGLLHPDAGTVCVEGENLAGLSPEQMLHVRRKFGMVFQQSALFDSMTVGQNVAFPLQEHTRWSAAQMTARVNQVLRLVRMEDMAHKLPAELSGGMRKRVGLARAVVLKPACVLYDEPTTGLDPLTTDSVDAMIMEAKDELQVTSVVISHDIGSALKVADDIAVIHGGKIVADCPPEELRRSDHPFVRKFLRSWQNKQ